MSDLVERVARAQWAAEQALATPPGRTKWKNLNDSIKTHRRKWAHEFIRQFSDGQNRYMEPMQNGEDHPLAGVPEDALHVARSAMIPIMQSGDMRAIDAFPVADAIVLALHEEGHL